MCSLNPTTSSASLQSDPNRNQRRAWMRRYCAMLEAAGLSLQDAVDHKEYEARRRAFALLELKLKGEDYDRLSRMEFIALLERWYTQKHSAPPVPLAKPLPPAKPVR